MDALQFVCDVDYDGTKWYFEPETGKYHRLGNGDFKKTGLSGIYMNDPFIQWQRKALKAGVSPNSPNGEQLKPHAVCFTLWKHWEGVRHAYLNH